MSQAEEIILITGYSGAGMSSVLKKLEDMGYEAFDNFPLALVEPLAQAKESNGKKIVIGTDTRTRGFSPKSVLDTVEKLKAKLVFITCDPASLQLRFTETRRRHPLAREKSVRAGIEQEQKLLIDILARAELVIDTTDLSIHDLRHMMEGHFQNDANKKLQITLMSFGFKYGLPREADIVMDVRFLKNPHWVDGLREKTGLDKPVGDYIQKDPDYSDFLTNAENLITPLIPRYKDEGKSYLTIAIGCTGGRHRSVYTVQRFSDMIKDMGYSAHIEHRDLKH